MGGGGGVVVCSSCAGCAWSVEIGMPSRRTLPYSAPSSSSSHTHTTSLLQGGCNIDVFQCRTSFALDLDRDGDILDSDHQNLTVGSFLPEPSVAEYDGFGDDQNEDVILEGG